MKKFLEYMKRLSLKYHPLNLGVTIDNRLSWIPHINYLHEKLKSATGMLERMRDNIPEEHYKPLYNALFESHMTYSINVLQDMQ